MYCYTLEYSCKINLHHVLLTTESYTCPAPPTPQISNGEPLFHPWEEGARMWYPVQHSQEIPLHLGKKGSGTYIVRPVEVMHTVSTLGYIIYERRKRIVPEIMDKLASECNDKKELGRMIQASRANGDKVDETFDIPICAFVCDTSAKALTTGANAMQILASPVIIIECTYLEESFTAEANRKGHVVWSGEDGLCPIVQERLFFVDSPPVTFVLIHFSLRYSDSEIRDFFCDVEKAQLGSSVSEEGSGPPHLVLWLDTGVVQLWYS